MPQRETDVAEAAQPSDGVPSSRTHAMRLGKQVASATGLLTGSSLLARCLSLLTVPILTRLVPPDAYGVTALVGTAISLLSSLAIAGLDMSYARAYHAVEPPNNIIVENYVWRLALSSAVIVGTVGALGWWITAPRLSAPREYGVFVAVGVPLLVAQIMSQTKARLENRYRRMAVANFIATLISIAVVISMAWWWRRDAFTLLMSLLAGYVGVLATLGLPARRVVFAASRLSCHERRALVSIGLAGTLTAPMYWVLSSLDRWFLTAMEDATATGIYFVGYNIAAVGAIVGGAVSAAWLPEAARLFETDRQQAQELLGVMIEKLILLLAIVWLAVVAAGGDTLRLLAAPPFHSAAIVIPFIAGGVFFNGVLQLANAGNLLAKTLHRTLLWWVLGALLCILLNLLLIPRWGILAAAITQTCCFGLMAVGVWLSAQRGFPLKIRGARLIGLLAIIVCIAFAMYPPWLSKPVYSLLLKFPVGIMVATLIAWATARRELVTIMRKLGGWKREAV